MKWTKGEWRITNQGERIDKQYTHQIGTHEQTVCYTFEPGTEPEEQQANAILIAAAPELYEALELAVGELTYSQSQETFDTCMANSRAALSKARGEK